MSKNRNKNYSKKTGVRFFLPVETKQKIWGILMILGAVIIGLSFFEMAGVAGSFLMRGARFLIGDTIFLTPLILGISGLILLNPKKRFSRIQKVLLPLILAILVFIIGLTGILQILDTDGKQGGLLGYVATWPLLNYFGYWATLCIFLAPVLIGSLIFWQFLKPEHYDFEEEEEPSSPSIIKKIFTPDFKVKEISPYNQAPDSRIEEKPQSAPKMEIKPVSNKKIFSYQPPPLDMLERERGAPTSGDTRINSAIIKKTLQNFNIDVAMSEVNIGPTVTQYTFKPAEGIKLSKITGLSNDLALALASHPIRIEAPIPGRALVGVEIPNKVRAQVRLRNLIENPEFQKSFSGLILPLGRDVSGAPFYADLTKMPHLLVAGSTGTGKTIFLNSLILSLLYQPSSPYKSAGPQNLRFILVDPKRVEFPVYSELPHLLCPVIYNATQTINALKWATSEMERRFDVLSGAQARDIGTFNETALRNSTEPLPFIVIIIDELADLMAAKGREIEAAIVRLAQMARAVGIHLVVATQRPSVEVITGLIKANITSRVTFQVASQVDSRTVLDSSGAEKLLGYGDMLFISAQVTKPKRIQGSYISEKEVRKIINYISTKNQPGFMSSMNEDLMEELEKTSEEPEKEANFSYGEDDPLYEDAKRIVIENNKASASLLQRRLRLGYARAARLIDMLEDKGIVGPQEGAKPREVYSQHHSSELIDSQEIEKNEDKEGWEKV